MLQPKKTKFRKAFKGRLHGNAKGGTDLNFGSYGLKALEHGKMSGAVITHARTLTSEPAAQTLPLRS